MSMASSRLRKRKSSRRTGSVLYLEGLEGRFLPSTVTNLADAGPGSLRDAIATTLPGGTVEFQPELTGRRSLLS